MADELATITGTVLRNTAGDADAAPWPHAAVVATPVLLDESAALVDGQTRVRVRADAAGLVTLHLWPGAWRITLPDGEVIDGADHEGVVVESGVSYDLLTLRGFVPGPGVSVTTVVVPAGATAGQNLGWDGTDLSWVDGVAPETVAAAVEDYLTAHPVDADPAGTAAAAVSAHELAADPHPGYTTAAEAAAAAPVQSVAGRTGAVTLAVADVSGAVATTDPRLSDARTPLTHTHDDRYYTETEADARYATSAQGLLAASASQPGHTHTLDATTDTATRVAMTPAERTKLSGVASGATANSTDAQLRDRTTHTGMQAISTVTGLQGALDGKAATGHTHTGVYAPALGADDNYVTDSEKAALHSHANKAALDAVTGTNTGDETASSIKTKLGAATASADGYATAAQVTKLDGIETGADVTDATNVAAAGAVMEGDTSTASMSFVVDEDAMTSDSATKVPTQQSVKAYADTKAPASGQFGLHALTAAASVTISADHPAQSLAMDQNTTISWPDITAGQAVLLWLTGAYTPTWSITGLKWAGGTAPTYASAGTLYHFVDMGTAGVMGSGGAYS